VSAPTGKRSTNSLTTCLTTAAPDIRESWALRVSIGGSFRGSRTVHTRAPEHNIDTRTSAGHGVIAILGGLINYTEPWRML
jgi:hypothetical protein